LRISCSNLATPSSGKDKTMSGLNLGKMLTFLCYGVPSIDALTSTEGPGFDSEIFERSTFVFTLGLSFEDRRLEGWGFDMM
jgi:hypothetical protein